MCEIKGRTSVLHKTSDIGHRTSDAISRTETRQRASSNHKSSGAKAGNHGRKVWEISARKHLVAQRLAPGLHCCRIGCGLHLGTLNLLAWKCESSATMTSKQTRSFIQRKKVSEPTLRPMLLLAAYCKEESRLTNVIPIAIRRISAGQNVFCATTMDKRDHMK